MKRRVESPLARLLGAIPNRLQLAGGWIDQPFVSQHNPKPPGSMVVVQIEPDFRPMDRSGIAGSSRAGAMKIWKGKLPNRPREELVRELYEAENRRNAEPSGSQDMIGLVYPGVNRLDYDFKIHGGVLPSHIESSNSASVVRWRDADPEIKKLQPDIYAVNEDGDKGGKREYCKKNGIEYLVLKRTPAPGLPRRSSTDLRGF
jgi:hypothetical protein